MGIDELETKIQAIRDKPLLLLCQMPSGKTCVMTVRECVAAKARYIHVVVDQLDELLGAALGGDNERV